MKHRIVWCGAVFAFTAIFGNARASSANWAVKLDELAQQYLKKRSNAAVVIGVMRGGEVDIRGFGRLENGQAPDAQTMYEIGSITKVFTGIALQLLVEEKLLALEDRADRYLPPGIKLAERDGRAITLLDLATHSSGLRRLPDNLQLVDNPYAKYTASDLYLCLPKTALRRKPGEDYEYSNFGYGLLGHILERRGGKTYEALVREKLLLPLGMTNTVMTLTEQHRSRLARGHEPKGKPTGNWDFDVLAGAGAFRSCGADLMKFIAANLKPEGRAIGPALIAAQKTQFRGNNVRVGLGWHKLDLPEGLKVLWHNGGTGGYVSFLGLDVKRELGVVFLSNYGDAIANDRSSDKLALDVLKILAANAAK